MPNTFKILTYRAFEPTEISGLKAWYDATTLTGADGSSVSAWLDQSGNEAHMYQSTSAAQPTLQTAELNGRSVVRFDGVDDFMNLTAPFDVLPTNVSGTHANSFSNSGQYLIHLNSATTPNLFIYKKNGNSFNLLTNPTTMPAGTTYNASWMSDDSYFAIGSSGSPRIQIYKRTGDTFSKISNPATLPSTSVFGCDYSSDNLYLATSGQMTGLMLVYKISGETYTALSNPATVPAGTTADAIKFSPDTNYLAVGSNASPFIQVYSRSGDAFTKLNDPTNLPGNSVYSIDWLDSTTFAIATNTTTTGVYSFDSGTGTFQRVQTIVNAGTVGFDVKYSRDKNFLALGLSSSPTVRVYSRSGTTYTALSNPASLPLGTGRGVAWGLNDSSLVVSSGGSPAIQAYTFDGSTLTNLTKLNMFRNVGGGTVFVVKKVPNNSLQYYYVFVANNAESPRIAVLNDNTFKYVTGGRRLDSNTVQVITSTASTSFDIVAAKYDYLNSDLFLYVNNSVVATSNSFQTDGTTSDTNSSSIRLGARGSGGSAVDILNGDIAEVIAYNRALTATEINNVNQYLSVKWGIALA